MPAGDVYRMSIQALGQNSVYMNVLAIQQIGAVDLVQADFQVFADGYKEAIRPSQNASITWRNWRAVQVFGPTVDYTVRPCERVGGRAFEANLSGTLAAAQLGDALPPQSALVITLGSGFIGRTHRGRIYVFGLGEPDQVAGTWVTASLTTLTTNFTTFFNKYKDTGTDPKIKLGIWSDRTAFGCVWQGSPPAHVSLPEGPKPDLAFTPATGFTVRGVVNTQRRRAVGIGR